MSEDAMGASMGASGRAGPAPSRLKPLLILPGTAFWGLVIVGAATENDSLYGVAIAVLLGAFVVVGVTKMRQSSVEKAERRRILATGRKTTARVLGIGTKGGGLNDHPMIDFELEVEGEDGAPYRMTTRALISRLAIPRVQPDCQITVHVDRRDRRLLVVDEALTPYGYD